MNERTASWILEFVLRQPIEDHIANEILFAVPIAPPIDPRLKKTLLLRKLSCDLSRRSISESTLSSLEMIDDVDRIPSDAMKSAYRAVAVECTVAKLREDPVDEGAFFDAVNRVWNGRVADLEGSGSAGLVSERLREVRREMEEAVVSEAVRVRLLGRETLEEAVEAVRVYLEEAEREMGPAFLEVAAAEVMKGKEWSGALAEPDNAGLDSRAEVASAGIDNGVVPDRDNDASNKVRGVITRETSKAMKCGNIAPGKKYDLVLSPEVEKAKEALKSSVANLQEAVKDPLPDAELVAAKVMTGMVEQPIREDERTANEDERGKNQRLAGVGVSGSGMDKGGKAPVVEGDTGDQCSKDQYRVTKPSLMDRNPTAHTYEWDDSIESLSEQSPNQTKQICLPSPKRRRVSPLKLKEDTKITRRRKPRRWSTLEEETLRKAVREHGVGNWKFILKCHPDIFEERTEVDLKDKWRNMTRS